MSKRVHFAATNRVYSPIPTTPSPCRSTSSLPSTPDLPTPPPELEAEESSAYPRSPYPQPFEMFGDIIEPKDMQIHLYLAYTPYSDPVVTHDLSLPISLMKEQYPPLALSEPATQPPLQHLTIVCPYLEWDISVKTSSPYPGSFVTVDDVLNAIYQELRLAVNQLEYDMLGPAKQSVDASYFGRLNRIFDPHYRAEEAAKGVKRIDFLMGRNRFMGLSGTLKGLDIWELNVS